MKTDVLFYRVFETSPAAFFMLLGMPGETAQNFEFQAIEFKEAAFRADGVFKPKKPGLPMYFVEVQFYRKPTIYADMLLKAGHYLKFNDPTQTFRGVAVFSTRSLEPAEVERTPYRSLLSGGEFVAIYLDELPVVRDAPLGLAILQLIRQSEMETPVAARALIDRADNEIDDQATRQDLIELIETVVLYKLPRLSLSEVQKMLQVDDIRKTRVYQEALLEGREEGREVGREEGREVGREEGREEGREVGREEGALLAKKTLVRILAAEKMDAKKIAQILQLSLEDVQKELSNE